MAKETKFIVMLTQEDRFRHRHLRLKGNEALTFAEYDIRSNWRLYKQRFLEGFDDEQTQ